MDNNQNNSLDRISYALGLSMGHNFRASGINEINIQDFADAVASVFYGSKPKMTIDEAKAEIQAYFTELEKKQRAQSRRTRQTEPGHRRSLPGRERQTRRGADPPLRIAI